MRRLLAILLMTFAVSVVVAAQGSNKRSPRVAPTPTPRNSNNLNDGGWVKFTSELGRFSVLMPTIPTDTIETTQSEDAPYTSHKFIAKDVKNVYLIAWVDYDPAFVFHPQIELAANRDAVIKNTSATLVNSRLLTLDGYQALEFTAETAERILKSRIYIVGRRPYLILISLPKDQNDSLTTTRFFDSFKVKSD